MANNCKYYKYQKYISRDNGQTWSPMNVFQKGGLYETCSEDCGYAPSYRWVHSYFDCDNEWHDLNEILKKQASYDGGATWTDVSPLETMTMLYEADSIYCGFEMPNMTGVKYLIQTENGTYSGECCEGTCECVRYSGDTNGATGDRWRIFVGDCVNEIGNCPIGGNYNSYYLPNTLKIIDDKAFYNRNIIKIRMPNSVQYIGDDAFTPSSLTSTACRGFNIPNNLRFVGRRAFSGCPIFNNSEVYFPNIRVIGESAFDNVIPSRQTLDTLRLGIHLWSIGTNAFRTEGKINNLIFENLVYPSISYYASNDNCTNWFEDLYDDLYSGITCPCHSSPCSDYSGLPDEVNKFGRVGSCEINHIYVPKHSINKYLNKWLNDYHGNNEFSYFGQYSENLGTYLPIITELEEEPEFLNLRKLAIAYDAFDEWYPLYSKTETNITKPLYDVYTTKSTGDSGSNRNRGIKTLEVLEGTTSIGTSGISSNTLNTVILPSTLDFINGASFYGCHYIKKVYSYATTPPELGVTHDLETAFWKFNPPTVYVPEELVGVYRSHRDWSGFTISAINESDFYSEKWETVQNDYICEGSIKYSKERKYTGASLTQYSCNEWTPTDEYRRGRILQANSTDCGFVAESEYKYIGNCLSGNNIKVLLKLSEQINRNNAIHLSGSEILGTCHGSGATRSCEGEHLSGLTIGNCVNFINNYTFAKFDLPSRVVIPDNVLTIEEGAFSACTSLETVDIGRNITLIGNHVFKNCSNLTTVIIRATVPPSLTPYIPFGNTPIENGTGYIYVPAASVNAYKTAQRWSTYADRIRAIPNS